MQELIKIQLITHAIHHSLENQSVKGKVGCDSMYRLAVCFV